MAPVRPALLAARLAVVIVAIGSVVLLWRLDGNRNDRLAVLRSRLVFGIPWGTVLIVAFVLGVYLFVQRGLTDWYRPLVIPFRAWSYLAPFGIAIGPFAHASPGHLLGNLTATLAFAPIAEFAWGHYPSSRPPPACESDSDSSGSDGTVSGTVRRSRSPYRGPIARILAFVCGALVVGVITGAFALGPIVGFSGVVFAFAGFALVRYPVATVVALAADGVLGLLYSAIRTPITVASASPSFSTPSWAQIAIQGHALGLLCGVLVCLYLLDRRETALPSPFAVFGGVLVVAVSESLWAVYWYRGGQTYVLFRALGVVLVFALAGLVALAVTRADRSAGRALTTRIGLGDRFAAFGSDRGFSGRRVATIVLVAALLGLALPAIPVNLTTVDGAVDPQTGSSPADASPVAGGTGSALAAGGSIEPEGFDPARPARTGPGTNGSKNATASGENRSVGRVVNGTVPGSAVRIREYRIRYAEDVPNRLVSVVDISAFGETTAVNTSGVIVANHRKEIWTTAIASSQLAFAGRDRIRVGGLGWERTIEVQRTGWTLTGGNSTYEIRLQPTGGPDRLAYGAPRATARPVLDGKTVSIAPTTGGFALSVARGNDTLGRAPIPAKNASVALGGLTVERNENRLVVTYANTTVPVATRETYAGG